MHRLLKMFSFTRRAGGNQEVALRRAEPPSPAASATTSDSDLLPTSVAYPAPKRHKPVLQAANSCAISTALPPLPPTVLLPAAGAAWVSSLLSPDSETENLLDALPEPQLYSNAGFGAWSEGDDPALAFLECIDSSSLMSSALIGIEQQDLHPLGAGRFQAIDYTLAGMFALCHRAKLHPEEITEEVLLTTLWMLESWGSQYRSELKHLLEDYVRLDPSFACCGSNAPLYAARLELLKQRMVSLQLLLLQRCGWSLLLESTRDVRPARAALARQPSFEDVCSYIESEAHRCMSPGQAPCWMDISAEKGKGKRARES